MKHLMLWSRDNPRLVFLLTFLFTVFFGFHATKIELDASPKKAMVEGTPEAEFYQKTKATFGSDNTTVVYVKDKALFTREKLEAIEKASLALQEIPGVTRVESIFTAKNFKNEDGSLNTNALLNPIPETDAGIQQARADALANPLFRQTLIDPTGTILAINVTAEGDSADKEYDIHLADAIDKAIVPLQGKVDKAWHFGAPATKRLIKNNMLGDQFVLVPIGVLILLLMIFVCLRSVQGAILPLVGGAISVVLTLGFMSLTGIPIQILTVIIPSIILVIGSAEDMHLIAEYFEALEQGKSRREAIGEMAGSLSMAVLFTAITTIVGFLSISINDIPILKEFGYASAFGISVSFLVTALFNPAYLVTFGEKKAKRVLSTHEERDGWFEALARITIGIVKNHKIPVLAVCGLLLVVSAFGIFRIRVDNNLLANFKKDSDIIQKSGILHHDLAGAQTFYVVFTAPEGKSFRESASLRKLAAVQDSIRKMGKFDHTVSSADYLALVHREMSGGGASNYIVPPTDGLVAQYLLFFSRSDLERYLSSDFRQATIVVRHNVNSSFQLRRSIQSLKAEAEKTLAGSGITLDVTSEGILIDNAADSIASGQIDSLAITLGIIFILMSILSTNLKVGLLSLVPSMIPIVIFFGFLGIFDIALTTGVAMVAEIAIGIAIDNTTHLMVRYHHFSKEPGREPWDAIAMTILAETRPMMTTTIALSLAFLSLVFSNFVPLIHFGLLSAMVLAIAVVADLVITPMLLSSMNIVTLWDMLGLRLQENVVKKSLLFQNMRVWEMKKIVLLGCVRTYASGEKVIRQGDFDRCMYLLLNGSVKVETEAANRARTFLQELQEGEVFGEIGLVDEVRRSADVVALQNETKVLVIDWNSLEKIKHMYPRTSSKLFLNISRILGRRLAKANKDRTDNTVLFYLQQQQEQQSKAA